MTASITTGPLPNAAAGNLDDAPYRVLLHDVQEAFEKVVGDGPVFTTDATDLWQDYLATFEEGERQFHNCMACHAFIKRYGGLVTIAEDGATTPILWGLKNVPQPYTFGFSMLHRRVSRAKVTGVFLSPLKTWGQPVTGEWVHLSLAVPKPLILAPRLLQTPGQMMAEKREDFRTVSRALGEFGTAEFNSGVIGQALAILKTDSLYRSEKVLGQAQWLADLQARREAAKGADRRANVTWLAVAKAPAGFCHPRSSMIGTLLEDLAAGMSFDAVARRFAEKMHPLQYQRPQAEPTAGNIAQAEKAIAGLGAAGSLARRYARLEEVETLWKPTPAAFPSAGGGVFEHLRPKAKSSPPSIQTHAQMITWEKFARTVLPGAKSIDLLVPSHGNFCGLLTAVNPDAPPILQWDMPERRNPVSWYVYSGGSPAARWSLSGGQWATVTAVCLQPSMWYGAELAHQGEGAILLLKGARDTNPAHGCLFPEILKAELRAVRATIEAHSRSMRVEGREEASANGIKISKGSGPLGGLVRVDAGGGVWSTWNIDRWD